MRASMASGSLRLGPGSADFSVTSDSLRGFSLDGGLPDVNVRSSSVSGRSSACGGCVTLRSDWTVLRRTVLHSNIALLSSIKEDSPEELLLTLLSRH